jgi:hypothetical protein
MMIRISPIALALAAGLAFGGSARAEATDELTATPKVAGSPTADDVKSDDSDTALGRYLAQVHGEVGATIGTDGTRAVYGTAVLPLGEDGSLTVSLATGRFGRSTYYGSDFRDPTPGGWAPLAPYGFVRNGVR